MSRVTSEATDRLFLTHTSEASERPYHEQDVDEPQDPLAMADPLSHTREKQAIDLTASKTSTNRRTRWQIAGSRAKRPTDPLSHMRAKRATDLTARKTSTNRRTRWQ